MKNILVLLGSPRYNGNSERLADAFVSGAVESGHEVEKVRLAQLKINPCKDCEFCRTETRTCIHKDDMVSLFPKIDKADVLVLATPIYYFSWPAQMKLFIDRLFPYVGRPDILAGKETVLLATCADSTEKTFDGLLFTYHSCCQYLEWENKGTVLAYNCFQTKDIIQHANWLQQAKELGKQI